MKEILNMSQEIMMSNCHTLHRKRPREPNIAWQDLEIQSLDGRTLAQKVTCSYAALLWSEKGLPSAAQPLPRSRATDVLVGPLFSFTGWFPSALALGYHPLQFLSLEEPQGQRVPRLPRPRLVPSGGTLTGRGDQLCVTELVSASGPPGSPTAKAGAHPQSSPPHPLWFPHDCSHPFLEILSFLGPSKDTLCDCSLSDSELLAPL